MIKFEKAPNGFQVRKIERAPTLARGQGQTHPGVEEEMKIREMESGVDSQSGYQWGGPELDIPPLQIEGVQFQATFSKPMMIELTFTKGPSTQPSFTEPTHTEIPPPQALLAADHAQWMDLSAQISSLGTRMEELVVVSDTRFYSMEDHMDQYQVGFTSQFEYLQQRVKCIEDRLERSHEEMMTYLHSVFPPLPHQP